MSALSRTAWHARPARPGPGRLERQAVEGIALHWPASSSPLERGEVAGALRSWQAYHMDSHGWSDIAYQEAVDQWGRRWQLRGLETQSGANGNETLNERFCAVLLVLAPGEEPTEELLEAARAVIRDARALYPNARRIVGHGEIRPGGTTCPGPIVSAHIRRGSFEPAAANRKDDDDMPTAEDLWGFKFGPENRPASVTLTQAHKRAGDARARAAAAAAAASAALEQARRNRNALEQLAAGIAPEVARRVLEALGDRVELSLSVDFDNDETEEPGAAS